MEPEQVRLKRKYVVGQTNGRQRGGHNMQGQARRKKQGKPDPPNSAFLWLMPSGKTRMVKD